MKTSTLLAATVSTLLTMMTFAGIAAADEPNLLGRVNGVIVHSTSSFSTFQLVEGTRSACERSSSGLDVTRCALTGSSVQLNGQDGSESAKITFNKMTHITSMAGNRLLTEYIFVGVWTTSQNGVAISSPAAMTFIQYGEGAPRDLRGYVKIDQYNISEQLTGTVVQ